MGKRRGDQVLGRVLLTVDVLLILPASLLLLLLFFYSAITKPIDHEGTFYKNLKNKKAQGSILGREDPTLLSKTE